MYTLCSRMIVITLTGFISVTVVDCLTILSVTQTAWYEVSA